MVITKYNTVSSIKNNRQNCWEFLNCPNEKKENCIVYQLDTGKDCYLFLNHIEKERYAYNLHDTCINCPWYKENNPLE